MEQFANNCSTAVASGGYTAGSGVLNVDSTAAPWPQTGDFSVSVFDHDTDALKVILKVTAINSATQFAVTAEGTDANAAEDDVVLGTMITARVVKNIGLVMLEERSASNSAALDFTNLSSLYEQYVFEAFNIVPATDGVALLAQLSTNGGSTWDTTAANYFGGSHYTRLDASGSGDNSGKTSFSGAYLSGAYINSSPGINASIKLFNPSESVYRCFVYQANGYGNGGGWYNHAGGAWWKGTSQANAVRILLSSGNMTSGKIRMYGVAK